MNNTISIVFPHQLFAKSKLVENSHEVYLIEEFLFFKQYAFNKQKIAFHRASMKHYQDYLTGLGKKVRYISSTDELSDIRLFGEVLTQLSITEIHIIDPTDDWLEQRLRTMAQGVNLVVHENPMFLNTTSDLAAFFRSDKKSFFQTTFYKQQRLSRGILTDDDQQPQGGQWTFDTDNRKKYPKGKTPPALFFPDKNAHWDEAVTYTEKHFAQNPGKITRQPLYPTTHAEANAWLEQFLTHRFYDFGHYEDAIVKEHSILHHSVISPLINVGLITPNEVVQRSLQFAEDEQIPINSTEGFIRQIIGWREFIRGMYMAKGKMARNRNFWEADRDIPASFYNGTTGIDPIDDTIKKVLETGYCHHIERLMVLGNFMLLCEFHPNQVYRWFMELFIDAYDWVMVPNVYGMCLFADGGTFATKPYIGGSNYIKKMSNYGTGDWEKAWDGLFWRFVHKHEDFFRGNPRTSMLAHSLNRMGEEKRNAHIDAGKNFLEKLNLVNS